MGRFRKARTMISKYKNADGYEVVYLGGSYKYKQALVHRIVGEAFCEVPEGFTTKELCIDHINMNKSDNRAENLHWVTREENTRLYFETLTDAQKLMFSTISNVLAVDEKGQGSLYTSIVACAEDLGLSAMRIGDAINTGNKRKIKGWNFFKLLDVRDRRRYDDGQVVSGKNKRDGNWAEVSDGCLYVKVADKYISKDGKAFRNTQASLRELALDIMTRMKESLPTEEEFEQERGEE